MRPQTHHLEGFLVTFKSQSLSNVTLLCQIIVNFAFCTVQLGILIQIAAYAQDPVDPKKANSVTFTVDILLHYILYTAPIRPRESCTENVVRSHRNMVNYLVHNLLQYCVFTVSTPPSSNYKNYLKKRLIVLSQ